MNLKDKLDLLWKYLILAAVIVFGILLICRHPASCRYDRSCDYKGKSYGAMHHKGMMGPGEVKVMKEIEDGDTTLAVWVNGKKIDNPEEFLKMHKKGICKGCGKKHGPGMKCAMMHHDDDDDDDDDD